MKMLAVSGVEVIGAGPLELGLAQAEGKQFLFGLIRHSPVNVVLANVPGFLPYVRFSKNGGRRRVLVTSVVDPGLMKKYRIQYPGQINDPVKDLRSILDRIKHDLAVVVIHASRQRAAEIVRQCPGIDLVIDGETMGHGSSLVKKRKPRWHLSVPMVYNNKRGQYVDYIDLASCPGRKLTFARPVEWMASVSKVKPDPEIQKMVMEYNRERAEFFRKREEEKFHVYMRNNPPNMFLGDHGCQGCHEKIWRQWRETRHARAIGSLKRKERENDGECLKCHTTGSGFKNTVGGFTSLKVNPWMAGVQCEACHGPGARHAQKPLTENMLRVDEKRCLKCHDSMNDPEFDYQQKWQKIKH